MGVMIFGLETYSSSGVVRTTYETGYGTVAQIHVHVYCIAYSALRPTENVSSTEE